LELEKNSIEPKKNKMKEDEEREDNRFVEPKTILCKRENLYKWIKWDKVFKVGIGLYNTANTCFLNSVLQCLGYTPLFNNYIKSRNITKLEKSSNILDVMTFLIHKIFTNNTSFTPKELINRLTKIGDFKLFRQEDSHEFLINLIEKMEECVTYKYKE
jgi:ubiquitin carboxyl-terminal hydrolase 36/42